MNYHLDDEGNPMDSAWYRDRALDALKWGDAVDQSTVEVASAVHSLAQVYATLAQAEALRELTEATGSNRPPCPPGPFG